jgi:hypothetical protein
MEEEMLDPVSTPIEPVIVQLPLYMKEDPGEGETDKFVERYTTPSSVAVADSIANGEIGRGCGLVGR